MLKVLLSPEAVLLKMLVAVADEEGPRFSSITNSVAVMLSVSLTSWSQSVVARFS